MQWNHEVKHEAGDHQVARRHGDSLLRAGADDHPGIVRGHHRGQERLHAVDHAEEVHAAVQKRERGNWD
jgi:hypothetical protein